MKTRRQSRENAFIAAFELSFNKSEFNEILENAKESGEYELDAYGKSIIEYYIANADKIDALIEGKLKGWQKDRIPRVCLTILRLAVAEMKLSEEDISSIVINEAVEITKKFANDDDYQFVNGVLGSIVREKSTQE